MLSNLSLGLHGGEARVVLPGQEGSGAKPQASAGMLPSAFSCVAHLCRNTCDLAPCGVISTVSYLRALRGIFRVDFRRSWAGQEALTETATTTAMTPVRTSCVFSTQLSCADSFAIACSAFHSRIFVLLFASATTRSSSMPEWRARGNTQRGTEATERETQRHYRKVKTSGGPSFTVNNLECRGSCLGLSHLNRVCLQKTSVSVANEQALQTFMPLLSAAMRHDSGDTSVRSVGPILPYIQICVL